MWKLANIPMINFPKYLMSLEASKYEPLHEISNNVVYTTSKGSDQPGSLRISRSLIRAFACRLNILWLLSYRRNIILEFLSFNWGYSGLSESTLVKMSHCWKLHVVAQLCILNTESHILRIKMDSVQNKNDNIRYPSNPYTRLNNEYLVYVLRVVFCLV